MSYPDRRAASVAFKRRVHHRMTRVLASLPVLRFLRMYHPARGICYRQLRTTALFIGRDERVALLLGYGPMASGPLAWPRLDLPSPGNSQNFRISGSRPLA